MNRLTGCFPRPWALLGVLCLSVVTTQASALEIVRNFTGGSAATSVAGGGNLPAVFGAAADWWEAAYDDDFTLTINFNWTALNSSTAPSDSTAGLHKLITQTGTSASNPGRETLAEIQFDNDGTTEWFLDSTPSLNEEWTTFHTDQRDLGAGLVGVGSWYDGYTGPLVGGAIPLDLLTVAKHEIGHALGMSSANFAYQAETSADNDIDIMAPLPFAGSVILTNNASGSALNAHTRSGVYPRGILNPTITRGIRGVQDDLSILANAQLSQFTQVNLSVPEPSSAILALLGFLTIFLGPRPRRRRG